MSTMFNWGILLSLIALLAWGFGDFFIQASSRRVGTWPTLFAKNLVGLVVLSFFVTDDLRALWHQPSAQMLLLILTTVVTVVAWLFYFFALRDGKISVVEPIIGLELPLTVILSIALGYDQVTWLQALLIALVFVGISVTVTKHRHHWWYHRRLWEKGVLIAAVGSVCMALGNFLVGVSSQTISPLLTIWSIQLLALIVTSIWLTASNQWRAVRQSLFRPHYSTLVQAILDNAAWLSFAFATTFISIGIATALSEGYIALAALLGILWGGEKLRRHQLAGVVLALVAILLLAAVVA